MYIYIYTHAYRYIHIDIYINVYIYITHIRKHIYMSSRIYLRKRRVDYRVPYFEVRRSLSLANEIGTEHRTRSIHMVYHT